jgi:TetR/AcrR family transcriptional regulator
MMRETFKKLPSRRQETILDSAAKVFAAHGVHRAKVSEICATAGISNGALYKYCKNKEELFLSVIDRGVDLMVHELFTRFTADGASFFGSLGALFRGFNRFLKRHRPYVELYADLTSCSMNRFSGHVAEKIEREGRNLFLQLVEEGKKGGEIDPDIRSDLIAHFLDSQMTLYAYSLVSEYHGRRFNAFFKNGVRQLTDDDKIAVIVQAARSFLCSPRPSGT